MDGGFFFVLLAILSYQFAIHFRKFRRLWNQEQHCHRSTMLAHFLHISWYPWHLELKVFHHFWSSGMATWYVCFISISMGPVYTNVMQIRRLDIFLETPWCVSCMVVIFAVAAFFHGCFGEFWRYSSCRPSLRVICCKKKKEAECHDSIRNTPYWVVGHIKRNFILQLFFPVNTAPTLTPNYITSTRWPCQYSGYPCLILCNGRKWFNIVYLYLCQWFGFVSLPVVNTAMSCCPQWPGFRELTLQTSEVY